MTDAKQNDVEVVRSVESFNYKDYLCNVQLYKGTWCGYIAFPADHFLCFMKEQWLNHIFRNCRKITYANNTCPDFIEDNEKWVIGFDADYGETNSKINNKKWVIAQCMAIVDEIIANHESVKGGV